MKKLLCPSLMSIASASVLFGQIVEPDIEFTETIDVDKYADYIKDNVEYNVDDDYNLRTFKAEVSGGATAYIPLGTFVHGTLHKLDVAGAGAHALSAGEYTFSVEWSASAAKINVKQILQRDHNNVFKIYAFHDAPHTSLVLKYTNIASTANILTVNHACHKQGWRAHNQTLLDNFMALSNEQKEESVLKGDMELHTGPSVNANGFVPGYWAIIAVVIV